MANTYNVYFGLPGNLIQIATEQAGLSIIVPAVLAYNIVYNWRVDTVTETETITGDVWSFTALQYAPPLPTGVTLDGDGNPTGTPNGLNNMTTLKRIVVAADNKVFYET
ncbi:hypothetical protein LCGC14_2940420 [marine sediment metagenome]|uniref:Uncharacterized protein n=1 Tax=marine sediment metagenome TaxID=412755 RepID=A0A0F8ZQX1_9ZZZZ